MKITLNPKTHCLEPVIYKPSAHCDERPDGTAIDMIVVHNISLPPNQFGSSDVEEFFCGQLKIELHPYFASIVNLRVAAHLFIKRTGEIIQFVPFSKRAWHAGESQFAGRSRCNDFSIGIELEGADHIPFTPQQYDQLNTVVDILMQSYPTITPERIVGHEHIAPGRKTDPGPAFDWSLVNKKLIKEIL